MSDHPGRIDHVTLPVTDLERSRAFYAAALQPLGFVQLQATEERAAFGVGAMPYLMLRRVAQAEPVHLALLADTRAQVDAFHAAATVAGGTDHGAPGIRAEYHASYYGAFVLDPDGHNIELVKHRPE